MTPHSSSLLAIADLERRDFDLLWLLAAAWEQSGLKPSSVTEHALVVGAPSAETRAVLAAAASIAGIRLLDAPADLSPSDISEWAGLARLTVVVDPDGAIPTETLPARTLRLLGPGHDPVAVIGRLYRLSSRSLPLRGLRVVWDGPEEPALTSWIASTRALPISLTQVGGRNVLTDEALRDLREGEQAGEFRRISRRPEFDADAREPLDLTARVLATAALLRHVAR